MKTLMTIVISVGASVMFTYYVMRRHNKLRHSDKCGCKKPKATPQQPNPKSGIIDEPIKNDETPITVGDILDAATGSK